jgi:hypothetical protein
MKSSARGRSLYLTSHSMWRQRQGCGAIVLGTREGSSRMAGGIGKIMGGFFRPFGARSVSATHPRLTAWAAIFRRSAAGLAGGRLSHWRGGIGEGRGLVSFAPPGLALFRRPTHALRRGLQSFAAPRLDWRGGGCPTCDPAGLAGGGCPTCDPAGLAGGGCPTCDPTGQPGAAVST